VTIKQRKNLCQLLNERRLNNNQQPSLSWKQSLIENSKRNTHNNACCKEEHVFSQVGLMDWYYALWLLLGGLKLIFQKQGSFKLKNGLLIYLRCLEA